jgi:peptidoglycan/LPS O-acetylase OafA/YrhL
MDALTLGAWLALAARGPDGIRGWRTPAIVVALSTVVLLSPVYVFTTGTGAVWLQVVKFIAVAVGYGALLAVAITAGLQSPSGRLFNAAPLRALGRYSYGLYVYHPFLIAFVGSQLATSRLAGLGFSPAGALWLRFGSILALSFAAAWLSWHLYEKPFLGLKRHFEYTAETRTRSAKPRKIGSTILSVD